MRAQRPRIPKTLDVELLLFAEGDLGLSLRGQEELHRGLPAGPLGSPSTSRRRADVPFALVPGTLHLVSIQESNRAPVRPMNLSLADRSRKADLLRHSSGRSRLLVGVP